MNKKIKHKIPTYDVGTLPPVSGRNNNTIIEEKTPSNKPKIDSVEIIKEQTELIMNALFKSNH